MWAVEHNFRLYSPVFPIDLNADVTSVTVSTETPASWAVFVTEAHLCPNNEPSVKVT